MTRGAREGGRGRAVLPTPALGGLVHQLIVILDFGSQYTQLIARRFRELSIYCEIRPCTEPAPAELPAGTIGVVLSGGPASVVGPDAPPFDAGWLRDDLPVLGICYGMQWLAQTLGGRVDRGAAREYGLARIDVTELPGPVLDGLAPGHRVWMSHGDHVAVVPPAYRVAARSSSGTIAAMVRDDGRVTALQFHPEVAHTEAGSRLLERFAVGVCGARRDWTPGSFVDEHVAALRARIGEGSVLCALSGGVDSSVVAALLHLAVPDKLRCIFVDNGLCRRGEVEEVREEFSEYNLVIVDAADRFLSALTGVSDPERKRKIIGETFIRVFEEQAAAFSDARFLAQGTLYPDVIESISVRGPSAVIKSHHNVGGLPERMNLTLVEPLRELFKDEVRAVGKTLGLSQRRLARHPFPGPGLAVRCLGALTPERVASVRHADAIVQEEILASGWYPKVWQVFAVLLPVRSVGVMGDERTYEEAAVIRAVTSTDGMTADVADLPMELLTRMARRIINEVRGINRVAYDVSSKPPGTIEWE